MTTMASSVLSTLHRGFLIAAVAAGVTLARTADAAVEVPANGPTASLTNADSLAVNESQFIPVE